jgi:hypothetical protein
MSGGVAAAIAVEQIEIPARVKTDAKISLFLCIVASFRFTRDVSLRMIVTSQLAYMTVPLPHKNSSRISGPLLGSYLVGFANAAFDEHRA